MRTAVLIFNPRAGRNRTRDLIDALRDTLSAGGYRTEACPTDGPGHASRLARDAAGAGSEAVFAFGGDGTLREAAAGLLGSETCLGFIPGGTINVMTRPLGLPPRPLAAARALCEASVREIDVGTCNGEPFLMQASAGVDAEMIRRLSGRLKALAGQAGTVPAGLGAWLGYDYPQIELLADGESLSGTLAVASNIPFYGGRWLISPDARPDDGKLDLVVFHGRGRLATLGLARDVVFGRHLARADVETRRVEKVELLGPQRLPVQFDGDAFPGGPPITIRLAPVKLRVLSAAE